MKEKGFFARLRAAIFSRFGRLFNKSKIRLGDQQRIQQSEEAIHNSCPSSSASAGLNALPTARGRLALFEFTKTLGEGSFAKVKLARDRRNGRTVAIKIVQKSDMDPLTEGMLSTEIEIMKLLKHPNVVLLFDYLETPTTCYFIMEYAAGGDLENYVEERGRLDEVEARPMFRQVHEASIAAYLSAANKHCHKLLRPTVVNIVSAVHYCHSRGVVHRDLKLQNILLDSSKNIKVADFGLSTTFKPKEKLYTSCGTLEYEAPEVLQDIAYFGPPVDVWSLGVVLYALVCDATPFPGNTDREVLDRIMAGTCHIPYHMSLECELLLKKFLVVDPQSRCSLEVVMKDVWLTVGGEDDMLALS